MKPIICILLASVLLLSAVGCSITPSNQTQGSVDNIFTHGGTSSDSNITQPSSNNTTQPSSNNITNPSTPQDMGYFTHGFAETNTDELGRYVTYDGGQLEITYRAKGSGAAVANGMGLVLFLDGQPQPFRFSTDETVQYMQYIGAEELSSNEYVYKTVYFTPVTGQVGDSLEIYMLALPNPEFYPSGGKSGGFCHTTGALFTNTVRLKFQVDAPNVEISVSSTSILTCDKTFVDLTQQDIAGQSQEEINSKSFYKLSSITNTVNAKFFCNVTSDTEITMQFDLYGCPDAAYGLVLFIDNQPVQTRDMEWIYVQSKQGQKCIVTLTLQLPEFDGSSVLYSVLVPCNRAEIFYYADVLPTTLDTYYLTNASTPEKIP